MAKKAAGAPQHQIAARVSGDTFHTLTSVAAIMGINQAAAIEQALAALVASLPPDTRRAVSVAKAAQRSNCPICKAS